MNQLKVFEHEMFGSIRLVEHNKEPWFVARDIALRLGYSDAADAIRTHCKKVNKITQQGETAISVKCPPTHILIIPESDVYRLIMRSKLPEAEKFEIWVMEEVLPSIRKHGIYATDKVLAQMLGDPDWAIGMLQNYKEERLARIEAEKEKAFALMQIEQDRPKVQFADAVQESVNFISVNALAKKLNAGGYNTGEVRLFDWMRKNKYVMMDGGDNIPTQKSIDMGILKIGQNTYKHKNEIKTRRKTLVTGKGQLYFFNKLCKRKLTDIGQLPIFE